MTSRKQAESAALSFISTASSHKQTDVLVKPFTQMMLEMCLKATQYYLCS